MKIKSIHPSRKSMLKGNPLWLLLAGVILMMLTHMTYNVDLVGWAAMVPFLLYLNQTKGLKSRLVFVFFLILAWSLIVFKIITEPLPYFFIPLYSIPIALFHLPGYLLYDRFKTHKLSILIFPAGIVLMEWIQYTFTPLASWGVAAYTQDDSIHVMQSVSLFGLAGLSFIIYWANTALAHIFLIKKLTNLNFYLPVIFISTLVVFGSIRLDLSRNKGKATLKVAAVGTDSEIGAVPIPDMESNIKTIKAIFGRTEKAAYMGAKIIVWNEAAFYLMPENETIWMDSIATLAKNNTVAIVASYVVPISTTPLRYENKLILFGPDGKITYTYQKHEPVPGEPAIKGTEEIISVGIFGVQIGGAICYDYDFPYLAEKNRDAGADIVALPSSDWRGIDPLHTQMACFRAIEQGHSVIRSTRFGLSATINPYGVMTAQMSSFNSNDKVLTGTLPMKKTNTLYARIGDILIYLSIGLIAVVLLQSLRKNRS